MLRGCQCVLAGDVKLIKAYIVQKHIDTTKVIGGDIDLLPKEAVADGIPPQHLFRLQQQGTGATGGVINLVDLSFAHRAKACQQLGNIGGGKELAAGLPGIGGVHCHQVFVSIAKGINVVVPHIPQIHRRNAVEQLHQLFVALGYRRPQLVAIDIIIIEQPRKAAL